jgi:hypothetical protein
MSETDALKEKSLSACEANPKKHSCSHSGGEDVTGDHRLGPGVYPYPESPYLLVRTFV